MFSFVLLWLGFFSSLLFTGFPLLALLIAVLGAGAVLFGRYPHAQPTVRPWALLRRDLPR
ncbi:MAG: hypothetical protein R3Y10_06635 [Ferrimonas sp.]